MRKLFTLLLALSGLAGLSAQTLELQKGDHVAFVGGGLAGSDTSNYDYAIKLCARFMSAGNEWALMMAAGRERVKAIRALTP